MEHPIYRYLRKCASRHDTRIGREDIVQEALLYALRKNIDVFDPGNLGWLAKAVRYAALNLRRKYVRYVPRTNVDWNTGKWWYEDDTNLEMQEELDRLSQLQRQYLTLRMHGYSNPEIAAMYKTSVTNVSSTVSLARKALRQQLSMHTKQKGP